MTWFLNNVFWCIYLIHDDIRKVCYDPQMKQIAESNEDWENQRIVPCGRDPHKDIKRRGNNAHERVTDLDQNDESEWLIDVLDKLAD